MTPATLARTRLLAGLRLGEPWALTELRRALRAHGGSLRDASVELGVCTRTLQNLRVDVPAVAAVLTKHALGRTGAARVAHLAYMARCKTK